MTNELDCTRRWAVLTVVTAMLVAGCSSEQRPEKSNAPTREVAARRCSNMKDLSFIPPGWHSVTVRWEPGSPTGDTVCIAQTQGSQIQFIAWLDAPLPGGYYVLRSDGSLDPTFGGCREWSDWQGQRRCSKSWTRYMLQRNP